MAELRRPFVYAKVRTKKLPTFARDAIFQNSVFQLSATLEDYVSGLIKDWFANLSAAGARNDSVPAKTRAFLVAKMQEEAFLRYVGLRDESDLVERTLSQAAIFSLLDDNLTFPSIDLAPDAMKKRKFPTVVNLEALFKRLGLPGIINNISARTHINTKFSLQAFMDVRNALAHENPPSITDVDVERYFRQIDKWIGAIDRAVYSHVTKESGAEYWT